MSEKAVLKEVITITENGEAPVLLHFQNGNLNAEATDSLKYATAMNKETREKEALLAVNASVYHGTIKDSSLEDTFIAVRNKKTNKIRLIQVHQASLINSVFDQKDRGPSSQMQQDLGKALLVKNFGGRRENRNFERAERMKVSVDVVKDQLEKTIGSVNVEQEESKEEIYEENLKTIRPPFNKSAKKVEDVYSLYDIVPKGLMDRLNQEAEAVLSTKMEVLPITSDYVRQRIKDIKESGAPRTQNNLNVIKSLIYLEALGNLIKLQARNMSKANLSNITEKVENDIRTRFSQPDMSSKIKTSHTKDKAICYYLALALLINPNYEIDMAVLTQELSVPRAKLVKFANYVNAKPMAKTGLLRLDLPEKIKPLKLSLGKRSR